MSGTETQDDSNLHFAERLRPLAFVSAPDLRNSAAETLLPVTLVDHHACINSIQLNSTVPKPIAIQFETTRNLYLYAWFVYRFFMVAKTHAFSTLEMGLKHSLPKRLPEPYQRPKQKHPMLAGLLAYAIDEGIVQNQGFRRWHDEALYKARQRQSMERIQAMIEQQLDSLEYDEHELPEIRPEDQRWDLVSALRAGLPKARNSLAHGSTELTNKVFGDIELVAEILNQLFPSGKATEAAS
ncbi:MAG: hypothetical protein QM749_18985 [Aquabacterium sp.]